MGFNFDILVTFRVTVMHIYIVFFFNSYSFKVFQKGTTFKSLDFKNCILMGKTFLDFNIVISEL